MAVRVAVMIACTYGVASTPQNVQWSIKTLDLPSLAQGRDVPVAGYHAMRDVSHEVAIASLLPNTTASSPNVLLPPSLDAPVGTIAELWVWPQQMAATGGSRSFAPPTDCVYTHTGPSAWTVMYLDANAALLGATQIPTINAPSDVMLLPRAVVYVASQHAIVAYGGIMANGSQADAAAAGINWTLCGEYHWGQCLVPVYSTYVFDVGRRTWTALDVSATGPESPAGPPGTAYDCCGGAVNCSIVPDGRAAFSVQLQYDAVGDTVWALSADQCPFTGLFGGATPPCAVIFRLSVPDWRWHVMSPPQVYTWTHVRERPTNAAAWMVMTSSSAFSVWLYGGSTWLPLTISYACWTASATGWYIPAYCDPDLTSVPPWFLFDTLFARLPTGELLFFAGRASAPDATNETSLSQGTWGFDPSTNSFERSTTDVLSVEAAVQTGALPPVKPGTLASSRLHALSVDPSATQWTYIAWGGVTGNASMPYLRTYSPYSSCAHRYGGEDALGDYFSSQPLLLHVFRVTPLPSSPSWVWSSLASLAMALTTSASVVLCCAAFSDAAAFFMSFRVARRAQSCLIYSCRQCIPAAKAPSTLLASQEWLLEETSVLLNASALVLTSSIATASMTLVSDSVARQSLQAVNFAWLCFHALLHWWAARMTLLFALRAVQAGKSAFQRCRAVGSLLVLIVVALLHSALTRAMAPVTEASPPADAVRTQLMSVPSRSDSSDASRTVARSRGERCMTATTGSALLASVMSIIQLMITWTRPQAANAQLTFSSGVTPVYVYALSFSIAAVSIASCVTTALPLVLHHIWQRRHVEQLRRHARVALQGADEALLLDSGSNLQGSGASLCDEAGGTLGSILVGSTNSDPPRSDPTDRVHSPVRTAWLSEET